mgnify:FL=1
MKALQYIKEGFFLMWLTFLKQWLYLSVTAYVIYALLWSAIYVGHDAWSININGIFVDFGYCATFTLTSLLLEHFLLHKKQPQRTTPKRLIINGFLTICLNLLIAVLYETYIAEFIYKPETDDFWGSLYIFCIVASFVAEFHVLREYTDIVIKQKEENLLLTKRLLKSQMDPHFVFNSLNILSGLIEEDPEKAEQFTVSLSRIYRYIINSLDQDIVPISEAMTFAKEYVSIMQTRYPSSIDFCDSGLECRSDEKILTMSMQLLIENAVRHNCPSPEHPLQIRVFKRGDRLVVSNSLYNNGQSSGSYIQGNGIGLKNLKKRYSIESGMEPVISITGDGDRWFFEVSLPIIQAS